VQTCTHYAGTPACPTGSFCGSSFSSLHENLLGPRLTAQFGPAGSVFAQRQTSRLVPQFVPRYLELPSEETFTRLTQLYVLSLFVLIRESIPVTVAVAQGHAPLADALGQQMLAVSTAPLAWVATLETLRAGKPCQGIVGSFSGLESEAFNVLLVTVLAAGCRETLLVRQ